MKQHPDAEDGAERVALVRTVEHVRCARDANQIQDGEAQIEDCGKNRGAAADIRPLMTGSARDRVRPLETRLTRMKATPDELCTGHRHVPTTLRSTMPRERADDRAELSAGHLTQFASSSLRPLKKTPRPAMTLAAIVFSIGNGYGLQEVSAWPQSGVRYRSLRGWGLSGISPSADNIKAAGRHNLIANPASWSPKRLDDRTADAGCACGMPGRAAAPAGQTRQARAKRRER